MTTPGPFRGEPAGDRHPTQRQTRLLLAPAPAFRRPGRRSRSTSPTEHFVPTPTASSAGSTFTRRGTPGSARFPRGRGLRYAVAFPFVTLAKGRPFTAAAVTATGPLTLSN